MDAEQGLPLPQRYWAIAVVALGITLAVLDSAIANVALPTIARTLERDARRVDLGRQRVSARDHDLAAAARLARRPHRLPARLPGRSRALHACVVRLRALGVADGADRRARGAGLRRRRHHEREHGARAHHLSARSTRARREHQRVGGGDLVGDRADGRVRRAGHRAVAVALRDQRADRPRRARDRLCGRCRAIRGTASPTTS